MQVCSHIHLQKNIVSSSLPWIMKALNVQPVYNNLLHLSRAQVGGRWHAITAMREISASHASAATTGSWKTVRKCAARSLIPWTQT